MSSSKRSRSLNNGDWIKNQHPSTSRYIHKPVNKEDGKMEDRLRQSQDENDIVRKGPYRRHSPSPHPDPREMVLIELNKRREYEDEQREKTWRLAGCSFTPLELDREDEQNLERLTFALMGETEYMDDLNDEIKRTLMAFLCDISPSDRLSFFNLANTTIMGKMSRVECRRRVKEMMIRTDYQDASEADRKQRGKLLTKMDHNHIEDRQMRRERMALEREGRAGLRPDGENPARYGQKKEQEHDMMIKGQLAKQKRQLRRSAAAMHYVNLWEAIEKDQLLEPESDVLVDSDDELFPCEKGGSALFKRRLSAKGRGPRSNDVETEEEKRKRELTDPLTEMLKDLRAGPVIPGYSRMMSGVKRAAAEPTAAPSRILSDWQLSSVVINLPARENPTGEKPTSQPSTLLSSTAKPATEKQVDKTDSGIEEASMSRSMQNSKKDLLEKRYEHVVQRHKRMERSIAQLKNTAPPEPVPVQSTSTPIAPLPIPAAASSAPMDTTVNVLSKTNKGESSPLIPPIPSESTNQPTPIPSSVSLIWPLPIPSASTVTRIIKTELLTVDVNNVEGVDKIQPRSAPPTVPIPMDQSVKEQGVATDARGPLKVVIADDEDEEVVVVDDAVKQPPQGVVLEMKEVRRKKKKPITPLITKEQDNFAASMLIALSQGSSPGSSPVGTLSSASVSPPTPLISPLIRPTTMEADHNYSRKRTGSLSILSRPSPLVAQPVTASATAQVPILPKPEARNLVLAPTAPPHKPAQQRRSSGPPAPQFTAPQKTTMPKSTVEAASTPRPTVPQPEKMRTKAEMKLPYVPAPPVRSAAAQAAYKIHNFKPSRKPKSPAVTAEVKSTTVASAKLHSPKGAVESKASMPSCSKERQSAGKRKSAEGNVDNATHRLIDTQKGTPSHKDLMKVPKMLAEIKTELLVASTSGELVSPIMTKPTEQGTSSRATKGEKREGKRKAGEEKSEGESSAKLRKAERNTALVIREQVNVAVRMDNSKSDGVEGVGKKPDAGGVERTTVTAEESPIVAPMPTERSIIQISSSEEEEVHDEAAAVGTSAGPTAMEVVQISEEEEEPINDDDCQIIETRKSNHVFSMPFQMEDDKELARQSTGHVVSILMVPVPEPDQRAITHGDSPARSNFDERDAPDPNHIAYYLPAKPLDGMPEEDKEDDKNLVAARIEMARVGLAANEGAIVGAKSGPTKPPRRVVLPDNQYKLLLYLSKTRLEEDLLPSQRNLRAFADVIQNKLISDLKETDPKGWSREFYRVKRSELLSRTIYDPVPRTFERDLLNLPNSPQFEEWRNGREFTTKLLEEVVLAETTNFKTLISDALKLKDSFTIARAQAVFKKLMADLTDDFEQLAQGDEDEMDEFKNLITETREQVQRVFFLSFYTISHSIGIKNQSKDPLRPYELLRVMAYVLEGWTGWQERGGNFRLFAALCEEQEKEGGYVPLGKKIAERMRDKIERRVATICLPLRTIEDGGEEKAVVYMMTQMKEREILTNTLRCYKDQKMEETVKCNHDLGKSFAPCFFTFKNETERLAHIEFLHLRKSKENKAATKCPKCIRYFLMESSLVLHKLVHHHDYDEDEDEEIEDDDGGERESDRNTIKKLTLKLDKDYDKAVREWNPIGKVVKQEEE